MNALLLYIFAYKKGAPNMDAISYSSARANLASTMDRVCDDHQPLIVGDNAAALALAATLEAAGLWVPAIRPPT